MAENFFKYNKDEQKPSFAKRVAIVLSGVLIGALNGLFGAGGGMIAVPVLTFLTGLDEKHAHATAIALILPLCLISTIAYALGGGIESGVVLPTVIGVIIGGFIGALLLKKISNDVVSFIFYGIMLFAGLKMIF